MPRARNIVKILMLTVAMLLLAGSRYAYAQPENTASNPYRDSRHSYRIAIDKLVNTRQWTITDKGANTYILPQAWGTVTSAISNGGYESVRIFFDRSVFPVGTWYLQYRETDLSHVCISAREFPLNVMENTFYLITDGDITNCNSQSDSIHTYDEVKDPGDLFNTEVTYRVTMNKNDNFDPTSWSFNANFSQAVTAFTATSSDGTLSSSVTTPGTDYHINIIPSGPNPSLVTVDLKVSYSNTVLATVTNNLTVTNGEAVIAAPPAPDALTNDNITLYPVSSPGDRVQAITMLSLPATQDILPGQGETAQSAQNPMQKSIHSYTVTMGAMANYGNAGTGWSIKTAGGVPVGAGFTTSRSSSATNDTITISFLATMLTGNYVLYYKETGANGCSAVREFPFTLQEPFDVKIEPASPLCATASGLIYANLAATTTTINYVATLESVGYDGNWSFNFSLSSNPAFAAGDVDVSSISVTTPGVTYSSGTGLTNVPVGVISVNFSVVYNGLYITDHTISVDLLNITGSHHEVDNDSDDHTDHILYSMPQVTVLAGVE